MFVKKKRENKVYISNHAIYKFIQICTGTIFDDV